MTVMTAKQARFESKRLEVIRGAARVFARLGFHGASLNAVADELQITPAALYYYVKSKDELLLEAGNFATERLEPVVEALKVDTTRNGLEKLRHFFRVYADYSCDDFGRCFALSNPDDLPSPYRESDLEGRRVLTEFARSLIREGISGRFDPALRRPAARLHALRRHQFDGALAVPVGSAFADPGYGCHARHARGGHRIAGVYQLAATSVSRPCERRALQFRLAPGAA